MFLSIPDLYFLREADDDKPTDYSIGGDSKDTVTDTSTISTDVENADKESSDYNIDEPQDEKPEEEEDKPEEDKPEDGDETDSESSDYALDSETDDEQNTNDGEASTEDSATTSDDTGSVDMTTSKKIKLFRNFKDLYNNIVIIISEFDKVTPRDDIESKICSEVTNQLNETKNTLYDYTIFHYESKSYEENLTNLYYFKSSVEICKKLIEKILKLRNDQ